LEVCPTPLLLKILCRRFSSLIALLEIFFKP
jgi:hypothetical protein